MTATNGKCGNCFHFWPYDIRPFFGVCHNKESVNYMFVSEASKEPCENFEDRTRHFAVHPENTEFLWCKTCGETFHIAHWEHHRVHEVYNGVALHDVEENVEFTFAGD